MSKRYLGIVVIVVIAFGTGYLISQSGDKSTSQDDIVSTSNSKTNNKTLDLSGQQLTNLSEEVLRQTDTTILNISNNQLTTLPAGIENLVNLEVLNVENNRLETFPQEISKLTNLREILANNNRMKSVPDNLSTMTWLRLLDISGNDIPISDSNQIKARLPNTQVKT